VNSGEKRKPLRQIAYEYIKEKIVSGEWPGGRFISERELQAELGMSKTPIRSALDRLESTGLVVLHPNQGAEIAELAPRTIFEIYELRKALETYAAREIAGKMDARFFRGMDDILERQKRAVDRTDIAEYVRQDRAFHAQIVAGLGNREYLEANERIQDRFILAVRATFYKNEGRLYSSFAEHVQIRRALEGDDPEHAVRLLAKHIDHVAQVLL